MPVLEERWSFGGADTAVESSIGALLPGLLLAGSGQAVLDGWWNPRRRVNGVIVPRLEDVTAVDDRGAAYAPRPAGLSSNSDHPDRETWPQSIRVGFDPVPGLEVKWIELHGRDGTTARLLASPRAAARVGPLTPVAASPAERELLRHTQTMLQWTQATTLDAGQLRFLAGRSRAEILNQAASLRQSGELDAASEVPDQIAALGDALSEQRFTGALPAGWAAMLTGAGRLDGPARHLDLAVTLPPVEEVTVRLDSLVSLAGSWRLYLRAAPELSKYGEPDENGGRSVHEVVSVSATDDRGGAYISSRVGGPYDNRRQRRRLPGEPLADHEKHAVRFQPRLDPLAQALQLIFTTAAAEELVVSIDL